MRKKKETKERLSNFELLRILAIVLIIVHHIFVHVIRNQLGDVNLYACGEMFNTFSFYKKLVLLDYAAAFGKIGVNLFILISGYFLCERLNIDIVKISKKLIGQLLFVTVVLVLGSFAFSWITNKGYIGAETISLFNQGFWFIGYYFLIVLIGKLFLNKYIKKLDKKKYLTILLIGFTLISFAFSKNILESLTATLSDLLNGLFLYLLGGYIKKYNPLKNIKGIAFIIAILLAFGIMTVSYRNYTISNMNNFISQGCYHQSVNLYSETSLVCLIISISLLELFRRIKLKHNKVINYIASSTLIIYIFHDNTFIHNVWYQINWIEPYYDNILYFFELIAINTLAILIIGVILQTIYNLIIKLIKSDFFKKLVLKKEN